jgi:methylated-DNA-[protein]-cysteine S-methyltransferase
MNLGPSKTADLLRSHGLRSTPQRRAILAAFEGGPTEHLSADEVHARASHALPDLGRGTVYATLAEFTELGLLGAFGAPEPVRYETNTDSHDHFRCRLCMRLFDLEGPSHREPPRRQGFTIERVELRAEGICADCTDYDTGLDKGAHAILDRETAGDPFGGRGVAAAEMAGPLGPLLLAASPDGLLRLAFEDQADVQKLRALVSSRRGSQAARGHLDQAIGQLQRYFDGENAQIDCAIDWKALSGGLADILVTTRDIPYAGRRSYVDLPTDATATLTGASFGANPIPIVTPCHRVTRGVEIPEFFVGGPERRQWLLSHERQHASAA